MSKSPSPARFPLLAVLGTFALAVIGVGFLALAVYTLVRAPRAAPAAPSPTRFATQVVQIPTTTQSPPTATPAPTQVLVPTGTPVPAATTPAASATPALVIHIIKPANVRTGPGLTYPIVAGINTGDTAPLIGRDSSAQWFAVSSAGAPQGTGWVSILVATFDGSLNDLPVIAPSSPPPSGGGATPVNTAPPASTAPGSTAPPPTVPPVSSANGIVGNSFRLEVDRAAVNADVWFDFKVTNTSQVDVPYGALAAHTDVGFTAQSWTAQTLKAGQVLEWRDHLNINKAGTYQVYLGICFAGKDACLTGGATWQRLSDSISLIIQ